MGRVPVSGLPPLGAKESAVHDPRLVWARKSQFFLIGVGIGIGIGIDIGSRVDPDPDPDPDPERNAISMAGCLPGSMITRARNRHRIRARQS
jgi:hypothetical protein